jgi:ABC-2 type transport system permease protein
VNRFYLVWLVAKKDWGLFLTDRRAAVLAFAVPILLASVFGIIFERPVEKIHEVTLPLLLVVEDDSPLTHSIVTDLKSHPQLHIQIVDRSTAEAKVDQRSTGVALIIPDGFGKRSPGDALTEEQSSRPQIVLLHHPMCAMESQWAEGIFTEVAMKQIAATIVNKLPFGASILVDRPFRVSQTTPASNPASSFNTYSHSFAGMTLQYLLFWGMEAGLLFLRERQRGIWKRLQASPAPLWAILSGRAIATTWIALLQIAVTFTFGALVFGVTINGSFLGFVMLAFCVSLLAAGTGLLVAAIGETEARTRNLSILVILAISMLGGLWLPAFLMPRWIQDISQVLPTSWAMKAFDGVTWQGHSLGVTLGYLAVILGFALVFSLAAIGRFVWLDRKERFGACFN